MAEARKHPILVVDDEPEILFSLRALLRRDFEVHTAEGGPQAHPMPRQPRGQRASPGPDPAPSRPATARLSPQRRSPTRGPASS